MRNKGCLISLIITILLFALVWNKCTPKIYDKKDLTDNYDKHEQEIRELIDYFRSIVPEGITVDIEINNSRTVDIFRLRRKSKHFRKQRIETDTPGTDQFRMLEFDEHYGGWRIDMKSGVADTLLQILNWDKEEVKRLKKKLDKVNCISITNSEPSHVGFQRSMLNKYSYVVFDQSIAENDSLMNRYNDKCIYIHYRDNVSLEYGSGAIGSICFPARFKE